MSKGAATSATQPGQLAVSLLAKEQPIEHWNSYIHARDTTSYKFTKSIDTAQTG